MHDNYTAPSPPVSSKDLVVPQFIISERLYSCSKFILFLLSRLAPHERDGGEKAEMGFPFPLDWAGAPAKMG